MSLDLFFKQAIKVNYLMIYVDHNEYIVMKYHKVVTVYYKIRADLQKTVKIGNKRMN